MDPKVALAIILAPNDREADLLDRCLSGKVTEYVYPAQKEIDLKDVGRLADAVDGIFITITGDNKKCEEVAQKYGAVVSHCKWEHDFAKARNFNFSQVPAEYEYIFWVDSDDVVRHPDAIRGLAKKCVEEVYDNVVLKYLYHFDIDGNCDVEHLKTRLIRNDNSVEWIGEVHEDFSPKREIAAFLNEDVEIIHLSDPKRIENSSLRNRLIASIAVRNNPKDPRTYWNLANTYIHCGKYEDAIKLFLDFLKISQSDEERFLAWFRLASLASMLGRYEYAIEAALEALALRPWYQDSYFLLGEIYFSLGKPVNAKEFLDIGLTKETPKYRGIVWNPLDYNYNPHLMLAKIYMSMSRPKEAIKHYKICSKLRPKTKELKTIIKGLRPEIKKYERAEEIYEHIKDIKDDTEALKILDSAPVEMKYYPALVSFRNQRFIKKESSGKDISFLCGFTTHGWNPTVARDKGVGGSEEAVIQLAKRFAKAGYNITVFNSTPGMQEEVIDGVLWKPFIAWNFRDKTDITIIWRHARALELQINSPKVYVDMHDVVDPSEFTIARLKAATKILFKSEVQRKNYPDIPDDKCLVIPHGLDVEEFDSQRDDIKRNEYLILNTSSPDRGLKTSMEIVNRVYDRLSLDNKDKLKFSWYYGFDIWDTDFENDTQMQEWKKDAMEKMTILKHRGIMTQDSGSRISQSEVTRKYLGSGILLYPSEFFEIGFISGCKAMLGGAIPFTTSVFAQGEFMKGVLVGSEVNYTNWRKDIRTGIDYGVVSEQQIEEFVSKIVDYIEHPERYMQLREEVINYARDNWHWDKTAELWVKEFQS